VESVAFCPRLESPAGSDPLAQGGHAVKRYRACIPVWGIGGAKKKQLMAVGGNLLSFDLMWDLLREPGINIIHTHAQNRLGGIGLMIARLRNVPLVVSVHGGVMDLPRAAREYLAAPLRGGFEWGKIVGLPLRSRRVLEEADAIITCNKTEAGLLRHRHPHQRVVVQPHGVAAEEYQKDHRAAARAAFPEIAGRKILLMVGRIDPVKNQRWVLEQAGCILKKFPETLLVLAGEPANAAEAEAVAAAIRRHGLEGFVLQTGGLPPMDPRLVGLFQLARALVLPSVSETFGLVILESWAAGRPVISSRTSGAMDLITPGEDGWLFDLDNAEGLHRAVDEAMTQPERASDMGLAGLGNVRTKYDSVALSGRVKALYEELIEEKQ
jgi:glycosyltransferase involved in cell wall biosynthesis